MGNSNVKQFGLKLADKSFFFLFYGGARIIFIQKDYEILKTNTDYWILIRDPTNF